MAQAFTPVDIPVTFEAAFPSTTQDRVPTSDLGATWSVGAGSSLTDAVDDPVGLPDDEITYIEKTNSGARQRYGITAFSVPGGANVTTLAVRVRARENAGQAIIWGSITVNGTHYDTSLGALTGAYDDRTASWSTNPNTGAPWLVADINGTGANPLEAIGVRVTSMSTGDDVRCTQLYATVTYGTGWTDISEDVLVSPAPTWSWGITGRQPLNLVASPGRLRLALRNDDRNSASLEGYYSPGHVNARAGFAPGLPLRVKVVASGSTSYKKYYVRSIRPGAGAAGSRRTHVVATDWMDEAARQVMRSATVQVNQRSDDLFTTINSSIQRPPANTDADEGSYVYPFALDEIDTHRDVALKAYQLLAQSGLDRIYLKRDQTDGETLRFEDHSHRLTSLTNAATFDGDSSGLRAEYNEQRIYNIIDCESPTRTRDDDGATTVLASIGTDRPVIGVGETLTLFLPYRDPDNEAERVAAVAADMVTPVQGTDYVLKSGEADVSANATVTATFRTTEVKYEIENTGTVNATVTTLQARGRGLYTYTAKHLSSEDSASQGTYGERQLTMRVPWQTDANVCQGMADWLLDERKDPQVDVTSMTYVANRHDTLAQASHDVDVGSRIALDESVTGVSASSGTGMWVNEVSMQLEQTMLRVAYRLEHAREDQNYFVLDTSALDGTDIMTPF